MAAMITPSSIKPCPPQGTHSRKQTSTSNTTTGELLFEPKKNFSNLSFLAKIIDKLRPLPQNRHFTIDQVKFLTTSTYKMAHLEGHVQSHLLIFTRMFRLASFRKYGLLIKHHETCLSEKTSCEFGSVS